MPRASCRPLLSCFVSQSLRSRESLVSYTKNPLQARVMETMRTTFLLRTTRLCVDLVMNYSAKHVLWGTIRVIYIVSCTLSLYCGEDKTICSTTVQVQYILFIILLCCTKYKTAYRQSSQPPAPLVLPYAIPMRIKEGMDKSIETNQWRVRTQHRPILKEHEIDALVAWLGDVTGVAVLMATVPLISASLVPEC